MKTIKTSDIILVPSTNMTREEGKAFTGIKDRVALAMSLAVNGYDPQYGCIAVVEIATAEYLPESIMDDGCAYMAALPDLIEEMEFKHDKDSYTLQSIEIDSAYDKTFKGKKGSVKKYLILDGNRRTEAILLANVLRQREGLDLITELPVKVVECKNMADFISLGMQYNCDSIGKRVIKGSDMLRATKGIFDKSGNEASVCRAVGARGTGQKLWAIIKIDSAMPELEFYSKCMTDSAYLSAVNRDKARKLGSRVTAYTKPEDEELVTELTEFVVKQTKEEKTKVMSKTILGELQTSPVKIVRDIINAVLIGDKDSIIAIADLAAELNEVYK